MPFERAGRLLSRLERIVGPAVAPGRPGADDDGGPEDAATEGEIDAATAAGDESGDAPGITAPEPKPAESAADLERFFATLAVRRTARGGLVIEAPPETASTPAGLSSGMAQMLQAAAGPATSGESPHAQADETAE